MRLHAMLLAACVGVASAVCTGLKGRRSLSFLWLSAEEQGLVWTTGSTETGKTGETGERDEERLTPESGAKIYRDIIDCGGLKATPAESGSRPSLPSLARHPEHNVSQSL